MVIEIRRARSDRNAAEFYGYPYFTFYLGHLFPFFFFVISYYIEIHNITLIFLFCKYVTLDVEDY